MIEIGPPAEFLERVRHGGVYFVFPRREMNLYWASCLADGFLELGIRVFANINARPLKGAGDGQWLFPRASTPPTLDSILVGDISDIQFTAQECHRISNFVVAQPQRRALICMSDTANELVFTNAIPVFAAHALARSERPDRRIPWAFGLNNEVLRMIDAAGKSAPEEPRQSVFIRNFRPSYNQGVRQVLDLAFVKSLERSFVIDRAVDDMALAPSDNGRFIDSYYPRLANSFGCLAYGGNFHEDLSRSSLFRAQGHAVRWIVGDDPIVTRWDSWRFWESLAYGCLTVKLDFDEYGFLLPVMPKNGTHYFGLRFDRLKEAVDILSGEREELAKIAERGRQWALTYYTPKPTALRFLRIVADST
jgi:hypothetical protein